MDKNISSSDSDEFKEFKEFEAQRKIAKLDERTKYSKSDSSLIAAHYNSRPNTGVLDRAESPIIRLRNFNNWIKSVLIQEYVCKLPAKQKTVLDLACGKGGDLPKWKRSGVTKLVCLDIAETSIKHAEERFKRMHCKFSALFSAFDAFSIDWETNFFMKTHFPEVRNGVFDAISCQFAYHYSFQSKYTAEAALDNIVKWLRPGGFFFGTIPNASVIKQLLYKHEIKEDLLPDKFREVGNNLFKVRLENSQVKELPVFGSRYFFSLIDAVTECPEYFVPFAVLSEMADSRGLDLVDSFGFPDFYKKYALRNEYKEILFRMNVLSPRGELCLFEEELKVAERGVDHFIHNINNKCPQTQLIFSLNCILPMMTISAVGDASQNCSSSKYSFSTSDESKVKNSFFPVCKDAHYTDRIQSGLTMEEVYIKRAIQGYNVVGQNFSKRSLWHQAFCMWIGQFKEPLLLLLICSLLISLILGQIENAISIGLAVTLVGTVRFAQEWRFERSIEALKELAPPRCRVLRESQVSFILASELVEGDVVIASTGDRIPADIQVCNSTNLLVDESILTGESQPVEKCDGSKLFMGTLICEGRGLGIVTATGDRTKFGSICKLIGNVEEQRSPLQTQLDLLGKHLSIVSLIVIVIVSLIGLTFDSSNFISVFTTGVSLAVAAIPEGLPLVATLTLAIGVLKLSRFGIYVRKMTAVETLGAMSVLCLDKTGTLTENHLRIKRVFYGHNMNELKSDAISKMNAVKLKLAARLCNDAMIGNDGKWIGNSVDVALREWLDEEDNELQQLQQEYEIIRSIPFSSHRRFSMVECSNGHIFWKGALELLIDDENSFWRKESSRMGFLGLRVIAFAVGNLIEKLSIVGLVGMQDPLRRGIASTLDRIRNFGIKIVMVTGDSEDTARTVASELGWTSNFMSVAGDQVENHFITQSKFGDTFPIDVVYRSLPEQKLMLVKAFQNMGHVVGMTGDGVNDAPALKASDIGIAMGGSIGTDVAKESAKVILSSGDSLNSLIHAIEEGRTIFCNVRKFVRFQLSTSISALGLVAIGTVLFRFLQNSDLSGISPTFSVTPLNPIQILLVNVIMDGPPAQSLGVEPFDPKDYSLWTPRVKDQPIIEYWLMLRILITAILILIISLAIYLYEISNILLNRSIYPSATLTFSVFVSLSLANAVKSRSSENSFRIKGIARNRPLTISVIVSLICLVSAVHYRPLARVISCRPLSISEWTIVIFATISYFILEEIANFTISNRSFNIRQSYKLWKYMIVLPRTTQYINYRESAVVV